MLLCHMVLAGLARSVLVTFINAHVCKIVVKLIMQKQCVNGKVQKAVHSMEMNADTNANKGAH